MTSRDAGLDLVAGAAAAAAALTGEALRSALGSVLETPLAGDELRIVTLPAPPGAAERLLSLPGDGPAFFWQAGSQPAVAGWGAAAVVEGRGADRFTQVRAGAARLWPRLRTVAAEGVTPLPARLFGGFSFLPGSHAAPWRALGEARFILPRVLYSEGDGAPRIAIAIRADEAGEGGEGGEAGVERLLALAAKAVAAPGDGVSANGARWVARGVEPVGGTDAATWTAAVESIRRWIAAGRAEKVVAARMLELALPGGMDAPAVLRRLRDEAAEARFAFRFGAATFLGATPERLISRRGLEIRTEALAGSMDADRDDRARELLASAKDGAEHAYVVRAIAEALAPLCARLDYPSEPRIQRLRHVLHLQTPFTGRLARPAHVLELVERLHPTPAVGGTPTGEALAWIAAYEPVSRGWFAAPVGWFDEAQDGEFVVALRSALVSGDRARLYAGAGIVRDSDPDAELAETEVKLRTMAGALGWTP